METTNYIPNERELVEKEFCDIRNSYFSKKRKGTSTKDVLILLVDHYADKKWWWAWEIIGKTNSKGGYISHRGCARLSDLALHTDLVEDRKIGRFKVYRVRRENRESVLKYIQ